MSYHPSVYRVVFFSSAPIGQEFLRALVDDERYDVVGVVTNPDEPSGRGMKMQPNIIKTLAHQLNIPNDHIYIPESLRLDSKKYANDAQGIYTWLTDLAPDYIIVIAYGKIIPQHILDIPRIAPINIHGSLLPRYRGASPIQSVFLDHETHTGITIMRMVAELDAGDMIRSVAFPIDFHRTVKNVIAKMIEVGPRYVCDTLDGLAGDEYIYTPQDPALVTHCGKISKEQGYIYPTQQSLDHIYTLYRAFALWPKIYFDIHRDGVTKTCIIEQIVCDQDIYTRRQNDMFCIVTDGIYILHPSITMLRLTVQGKSSTDRSAFVQGYLDQGWNIQTIDPT